MSRSPKTVIATVRGIGVAVMTSMCGRPSPAFTGEPTLRSQWEDQRARVQDWQKTNNDFWAKNGGGGPTLTRH